jgi:hypothetical protein
MNISQVHRCILWMLWVILQVCFSDLYIVQFQNGGCVMSGQIIFLAISLNFHRIVLCFSYCVVLWTYSL